MNIQGVSQNTQAASSARQSDPRIKSLEKQIQDTQKQIQDIRANEKMDPKTKSEKIKEYEQQIQLLQQAKAQIQAEQRQVRQNSAENQQPVANDAAKTEDIAINEKTQSAFIKIDSLKETKRATGIARVQEEGKLRKALTNNILTKPDPAAAADAMANIAKIDNTVMHKADAVVKDLEESAKESGSSSKGGEVREEEDGERVKSGTGRMEPGQFLSEEA